MLGKVLVTGGLGNLGSYITKHLHNCGCDIYVLTRKAAYQIPDCKYTILEADITDREKLEATFKDLEINYCIHTASFNEFFLPGYPEKALQVNTLGTRNLLEVLANCGIKHFIYFSTFHVYGINRGIVTEEAGLNPKNDYASTHLFAEIYVKQFAATHGVDYTILRLTNSYGAPLNINSDKWYLVLNDLVRTAYDKQVITLTSNGEAKRDFIYMGDVARITRELLDQEPGNTVYNLSSGQTFKVIDLAVRVQKAYLERYGTELKISINEADKTEYPELKVDNAKLKSILNFETQDMFDQSIAEIFDLLEKENA